MADENPFANVPRAGEAAPVVAAPSEPAVNPFANVPRGAPLPPEPSVWDDIKGMLAGTVLPPVTGINNTMAIPLEDVVAPGTSNRSASIQAQQYLQDVGSERGRTVGRAAGDIAMYYGLRRLGVPPAAIGGIIGASQPADSYNETFWNALGGVGGGMAAKLGLTGLLGLGGRPPAPAPAAPAAPTPAPTAPTTLPIRPTPAPNPNNPAAVQAWLRQNYGNVPNAVPAAPVPPPSPPTTGGMTPTQIAAATAAGTGLGGLGLLGIANWDKTKQLAQDYLGPDWWMLGAPALAAGYALHRGGGTQIGQRIGQGLLPLITSLGAQAGATTAGRYANEEALPNVEGLLPWMASGF